MVSCINFIAQLIVVVHRENVLNKGHWSNSELVMVMSFYTFYYYFLCGLVEFIPDERVGLSQDFAYSEFQESFSYGVQDKICV